MAKKIDEIKADNERIRNALTNIAADIIALNDKIADTTTPEDLEDLKADSADLAERAEKLAAQTPDEET